MWNYSLTRFHRAPSIMGRKKHMIKEDICTAHKCLSIKNQHNENINEQDYSQNYKGVASLVFTSA